MLQNCCRADGFAAAGMNLLVESYRKIGCPILFEQSVEVFLTIVSSHARPLEPWNPLNDLNARRYASWTTSCASCSLRISHLAKLCAASRWGNIIASKDTSSCS